MELCRNLHYAQSLDGLSHPSPDGRSEQAIVAGRSGRGEGAGSAPGVAGSSTEMPRQRVAASQPGDIRGSLGVLDFGASAGVAAGALAPALAAPAPPAVPAPAPALGVGPESAAAWVASGPRREGPSPPEELAAAEFTAAATELVDAGHAPAAEPAGAAAPPPALLMPSAAERRVAFDRWDSNGNGGLSLAEIDKAVVELYPAFNHKPALMRAYKAADKSGDGFIERSEFKKLLHYLVYFGGLWDKFEQIDQDGDRRLSREEFTEACAVVGHVLSAAEAAAEFAAMDDNESGYVLFDEFCMWSAIWHHATKAGFGPEEEPIAIPPLPLSPGTDNTLSPSRSTSSAQAAAEPPSPTSASSSRSLFSRKNRVRESPQKSSVAGQAGMVDQSGAAADPTGAAVAAATGRAPHDAVQKATPLPAVPPVMEGSGSSPAVNRTDSGGSGGKRMRISAHSLAGVWHVVGWPEQLDLRQRVEEDLLIEVAKEGYITGRHLETAVTAEPFEISDAKYTAGHLRFIQHYLNGDRTGWAARVQRSNDGQIVMRGGIWTGSCVGTFSALLVKPKAGARPAGQAARLVFGHLTPHSETNALTWLTAWALEGRAVKGLVKMLDGDVLGHLSELFERSAAELEQGLVDMQTVLQKRPGGVSVEIRDALEFLQSFTEECLRRQASAAAAPPKSYQRRPRPKRTASSSSPVKAVVPNSSPSSGGGLALEMPDKAERGRLFKVADRRGQGHASLSAIEGCIALLHPSVSDKMLFYRAYGAANQTRDGIVDRREFRLILENVCYFAQRWATFALIEREGSDALGADAFQETALKAGLAVADADVLDQMVSIEEEQAPFGHAGRLEAVSFDGFCSWAAAHYIGDTVGVWPKHRQPPKVEAEPCPMSTPQSNGVAVDVQLRDAAMKTELRASPPPGRLTSPQRRAWIRPHDRSVPFSEAKRVFSNGQWRLVDEIVPPLNSPSRPWLTSVISPTAAARTASPPRRLTSPRRGTSARSSLRTTSGASSSGGRSSPRMSKNNHRGHEPSPTPSGARLNSPRQSGAKPPPTPPPPTPTPPPPPGRRVGRSLSGVWRAVGEGIEEMFVLQHDLHTGEISGGHVESGSDFFLIKDGLLMADTLSFVQMSSRGPVVHWEAVVKWLGEVPTLCRGVCRGGRRAEFTAVMLHDGQKEMRIARAAIREEADVETAGGTAAANSRAPQAAGRPGSHRVAGQTDRRRDLRSEMERTASEARAAEEEQAAVDARIAAIEKELRAAATAVSSTPAVSAAAAVQGEEEKKRRRKERCGAQQHSMPPNEHERHLSTRLLPLRS